MTAESERRNLMPIVIGIAFTCVFLVLLAYLAQRRKSAGQDVPQLLVTNPLANAVVDSPLVVRFTSSAPIELQPTGWGYQHMHLHAALDNEQYMPAAADITQVDSVTYDWLIAAPRSPRPRHLHLGWADMAHRPLPYGGSTPVEVTIR